MIPPEIRLRRAIHANDALLVARILRSHPQLLHNPDTSASGLSNSNLHLAASLGHLALVQLLVEQGHEAEGVSLNERHETALLLAARAGHTETVHFLCQTMPECILRRDVPRGRDAIMEAAQGGHDTVVQILLTYVPGGAAEAVRREDVEGNTALHFASSSGHLLVLRTLLAAGADPHHQNVWRWTPVAYSASVQAEVYLKGLMAEIDKRRQLQGATTTTSASTSTTTTTTAPQKSPGPSSHSTHALSTPSSTLPSSSSSRKEKDKSKKSRGALAGLRIVREED